MSSKIIQLRQGRIVRNATGRPKAREGNGAYRVRKHLTEAEMNKLLVGSPGAVRVPRDFSRAGAPGQWRIRPHYPDSGR
jgi:hypothetical protein